MSAPDAARRAWMLGQASRGLTRRSRVSPKFAMARAAVPMFSPSCGSTRTTIGPATAIHSLVWSVPDPGIGAVYAVGAVFTKAYIVAPSRLVYLAPREAMGFTHFCTGRKHLAPRAG